MLTKSDAITIATAIEAAIDAVIKETFMRDGVGMLGLRYDEVSSIAKRAALASLNVTVDPDVPKSEIQFRYGDRVVGRITDLKEE